MKVCQTPTSVAVRKPVQASVCCDPRERNGERVGTALQAVHQDGGERRADHGAAAEAHDGHAGRHAAPVGEPLDERRDRRDVAEAQADAADHAGAEPHEPKLMDVDAERADQQAAAPAQRRDETRLARPDALEPAAPDRRGNAEQQEEEREHPAEVELAPVAVRGKQRLQRAGGLLTERDGACGALRHGLPVGTEDGALQRLPEHREAVGHADAEMDAKRCRRHEPAVEPRLGDDPLSRKERRRSVSRSCAGGRHDVLPLNADLGHGSKAISLTSSCSRYYPHSSGPPANRSRGRSGDYKVRSSSTSASDDSNSGDDSDSTQREQLREVPPERLQFPLSEQPVMDRKQRSRSVRLKSSIVYEASFVLPPSEC